MCLQDDTETNAKLPEVEIQGDADSLKMEENYLDYFFQGGEFPKMTAKTSIGPQFKMSSTKGGTVVIEVG